MTPLGSGRVSRFRIRFTLVNEGRVTASMESLGSIAVRFNDLVDLGSSPQGFKVFSYTYSQGKF